MTCSQLVPIPYVSQLPRDWKKRDAFSFHRQGPSTEHRLGTKTATNKKEKNSEQN